MCDTVFTIGQRGGYLFHSPSDWKYAWLPEKVATLFSENKIGKVYCLTLGMGHSFFLAYKERGSNTNRILADGLPKSLTEFLYERDVQGFAARTIPSLQVSLGPYNKSWWATDGVKWKWYNLPAELTKEIGKIQRQGGGWTVTPRFVSLGVGGDYIMLTDANGGTYNLSNYRELHALIVALSAQDANGLSLIHRLYLSPYVLQCAILEATHGMMIGYNVPARYKASFDAIVAAVKKDTTAKLEQELAQKRAMAQAAAAREARARELQTLELRLAETRLADQIAARRIAQQHATNMATMNATFNISMMNMMSKFWSGL